MGKSGLGSEIRSLHLWGRTYRGVGGPEEVRYPLTTPSCIPSSINHYDPPLNPSSHNQLCECHALVDISSTQTDKDQSHRQPLNDPHLHLHTKQPTWDQERTPFMFLMMMTHIARDVGKRGTLLGTVIENINLIGDNMCRYQKGRTP